MWECIAIQRKLIFLVNQQFFILLSICSLKSSKVVRKCLPMINFTSLLDFASFLKWFRLGTFQKSDLSVIFRAETNCNVKSRKIVDDRSKNYWKKPYIRWEMIFLRCWLSGDSGLHKNRSFFTFLKLMEMVQIKYAFVAFELGNVQEHTASFGRIFELQFYNSCFNFGR